MSLPSMLTAAAVLLMSPLLLLAIVCNYCRDCEQKQKSLTNS